MTRRLPLIVAVALVLPACSPGRGAPLATGSPAAEFSLPGADGRTHALADYAVSPVLALVFTCNSCPVSQLYEARIQQLYDDYRGKGVAVVAINANRPESMHLADLAFTDGGETLEDMKGRAALRRLQYPYLAGGTETAARYGVTALPHVFVFDKERTLRYEGRFDDNIREDLVRSRYARDAVDAVLAGRPVPLAHTAVEGCQVKGLAPAAADEDLARFERGPVPLRMAGPDDLRRLRQNGTGKLLLVNFWATWCAPCAAEFPDLEATYRRYERRGLEFVTVSVNDPEERPAVLQFLEAQRASHDNRLFASSDVYGLQAAFDPDMPAPVPFTLLLAPNGDVVYQELGELTVGRLRRAILANLPEDRAYPGHRAYWSTAEH
jgi:thiol-disulfide isomerase/thioredoxin